MKELDKAPQRAMSRLIREWITSEPIRRYLRYLFKLPVNPSPPGSNNRCLMSLMRNGTSDFLGTLYIEFFLGYKCQVSTLGRRAMSVKAEFQLIAKDAAFHHIRCGSTASVKEVIAAARLLNPYLQETDCELVGIILDRAIVHGPFVCFDLREP